MKKYLILFLLFLFINKETSAQYVFIPDSNFRNYIHDNIDTAAILGLSLDTTNVNVISLKSLELYFFNNLVEDIEGIQYFDSLEVLKINFLFMQSLPQLPPRLKRLEASANQFNFLPPLPESLEYMDLSFNDIGFIPSLPSGMVTCNVSSNHLFALPPLPDSLVTINAADNHIEVIDSFPDHIVNIVMWDNRLDSLPDLPVSVRLLNIIDNDIEELPLLPDSISYLFCSNNPLTSFPQLPEGIIQLDCINTLSCLPVLPNSLQHVNFDGCLSNRPVSMVEYYPVCNLVPSLIEVPDTAAAQCNDTLVMSPGYASYQWSTGDTTSSIANVCRTVYDVTITDNIGCIYTSHIDITDSTDITVSMVLNTETSCNSVGMCGYVADVSVSGGTPPYSYLWSDSNGEIDFGVMDKTAEDLIHFCLSDILSVDMLKCVVTDALGRKDSLEKFVFDNIPPAPYYVDIVNPICAGYPTGYIYLEDDPVQPGGEVFIMEIGLDTGAYVFTVPYGNGCEQTYDIHLDYQFEDCRNMYGYDITPPDSGMCNGVFTLVDNVDHGIYNLANTSLSYDGFYLFDGTNVASTDLCANTWYYYYVFDFNIGYFESDSIYISLAESIDVYPGDANNDGVANNVDLLALGIAYNETGYARADTALTWLPKPVEGWMPVFADSTNMCHADCNGNGIVNSADTTAIILNYGLTHSRALPQAASVAPVLYIEVSDTVEANQVISIPVVFGDTLTPADSLYGIAFTISYDPTLVDVGSAEFIADSSWMGVPGQDLIHIQKSMTAGNIDVALTRIDHADKDGYGSIGHVNLRVKAVVDTSMFVVSTSQVLYTSNAGNYRVANGISDTAYIYPSACDLHAALTVFNNCNSLQGGVAQANIITGTGPFNYDWSLPNGSIIPVVFDIDAPLQDSLPSALYQVIITDGTGCADTVSATVSSEDGNLITATIQNPTCQQLCDGWIWLKGDSILGPVFNVTWNGGQTGSILTGLCPAIYTATIQWGIGCSRIDNFMMTDPSPLNYIVSADSASCNVCNGAATVTLFGGRQPYSYSWTTPSDTGFHSNDSTVTGLCYNTPYIYEATDNCGVEFRDTVFFDDCDSLTSSIGELTLANQPVIFPNPNNGNFQVRLGRQLTSDAVMEIINAQGSIVFRTMLNKGQDQADIFMDERAGLYICRIYVDGEPLQVTFIRN